jgi:hypothetical protein
MEGVRGGTQARRAINTHATIMVTVTVLVVADMAWRHNDYHTHVVSPIGITVLSAVIAVLVAIGATFGGSLVFEYGFNVETAGDGPVWHKSEIDVFPGHHGRAEELCPAPAPRALRGRRRGTRGQRRLPPTLR